MVFAGECAEGVARADDMDYALCGLRRFFVGLSVMRIDVEIMLFQGEQCVAELTIGKIKNALCIEWFAHIANLKMQVGTGAASSAAAKSDDFASLYKFVFFYKVLGEVCVISFQTVGVAYNNQVAISACISHFAYYAHFAIEGCADGVAGSEGDVGALVVAMTAEFPTRSYMTFDGTRPTVKAVCKQQIYLSGQRCQCNGPPKAVL